jgi:hypothetical protein
VLKISVETKAMAIRSELTLMALAAACAIAFATPASAQTGAEYPRTGTGISTVPGGGMGGSIGGGSIGAPAPSGSGETKTTEIPYSGSPDEDLPPSARPAHPIAHHHVGHRAKASPVDTSVIEPAQGHLKLLKDSWAYERPSKSSTQIEQVHAGKYVNVMGSSKYYAQVKLKSGEIAYVPLAALQLLAPTDKMFLLTSDANVLTGPTHGSAKIAEVHKGHDVHVVGIALNYLKIRMKDGLEGYIPINALQ